MAVPVPSTTITIPTDWISQGNNNISPSTKSSSTSPNVYCLDDQCEAFKYELGSVSITINEMIDCRPVLQATGSLSLRFPAGTDAANIKKVTDFLADNLSDAIIANTCPA